MERQRSNQLYSSLSLLHIHLKQLLPVIKNIQFDWTAVTIGGVSGQK